MYIIEKYFPNLSHEQNCRFGKMAPLYRNWNKIIRLIPRKDINVIYEEHILHSLAVARVINFRPGSRILDVGTGGGFPGIPLAILFPACQFVLIDSMQKRINVVKSLINSLEIFNATAIRVRIEDIFDEFDFVTGRAVAAFPTFVDLVRKNISGNSRNNRPNGIIYLKGGNFEDEIVAFAQKIEVTEISKFFSEQCFESKKVVYLPINNYVPSPCE